jgi:hypothetical protein
MNENKKKTLDNFLAMNSPPQLPNEQDNRELPMPSQAAESAIVQSII